MPTMLPLICRIEYMLADIHFGMLGGHQIDFQSFWGSGCMQQSDVGKNGSSAEWDDGLVAPSQSESVPFKDLAHESTDITQGVSRTSTKATKLLSQFDTVSSSPSSKSNKSKARRLRAQRTQRKMSQMLRSGVYRDEEVPGSASPGKTVGSLTSGAVIDLEDLPNINVYSSKAYTALAEAVVEPRTRFISAQATEAICLRKSIGSKLGNSVDYFTRARSFSVTCR